MRIQDIALSVFLAQLLMQWMLKIGIAEYKGTTPMYEDAITTILFITWIAIAAIKEKK